MDFTSAPPPHSIYIFFVLTIFAMSWTVPQLNPIVAIDCLKEQLSAELYGIGNVDSGSAPET
jgi:hypothetical protein